MISEYVEDGTIGEVLENEYLIAYITDTNISPVNENWDLIRQFKVIMIECNYLNTQNKEA
jgi:hypothetical protein